MAAVAQSVGNRHGSVSAEAGLAAGEEPVHLLGEPVRQLFASFRLP